MQSTGVMWPQSRSPFLFRSRPWIPVQVRGVQKVELVGIAPCPEDLIGESTLPSHQCVGRSVPWPAEDLTSTGFQPSSVVRRGESLDEGPSPTHLSEILSQKPWAHRHPFHKRSN